MAWQLSPVHRGRTLGHAAGSTRARSPQRWAGSQRPRQH